MIGSQPWQRIGRMYSTHEMIGGGVCLGPEERQERDEAGARSQRISEGFGLYCTGKGNNKKIFQQGEDVILFAF